MSRTVFIKINHFMAAVFCLTECYARWGLFDNVSPQRLYMRIDYMN